MQDRYVKTNGITLHVMEDGPQDGPPVILLHGFPEFWYGWRKQIGVLASAGYHVFVPDQRGYNLSDKPSASGRKWGRSYRWLYKCQARRLTPGSFRPWCTSTLRRK